MDVFDKRKEVNGRCKDWIIPLVKNNKITTYTHSIIIILYLYKRENSFKLDFNNKRIKKNK